MIGDGRMVTSKSPTVSLKVDNQDSPALERVKTAGIELFYESGFLATTIRMITGACNITAPAFYNHFASKEALLYAIINDANTILETDLSSIEIHPEDPERSLQSLVSALVRFNLTRPKEARIANREYGSLQSPLKDEVVDHRRRIRSLFESVLVGPGIQRGLIRPGIPSQTEVIEVRFLAISIINLCIDSSDWYRTDGPLSMEDVTSACCRLVLRMTFEKTATLSGATIQVSANSTADFNSNPSVERH